MKELSINWFTEGIIDFEHKKYLLLAYLQHTTRYFDEKKLYPFLADLIFHYQNLVLFKQNKQQVTEHFPKKVKQIDLDNFRIEYEQLMHNATYMDELESILDFAIPRLKAGVEGGKEIYDFVEQNMEIWGVGIMPLQTDAGYVLLNNGHDTDIYAFGYQITLFTDATEPYRAIETHYISRFIKRFSNTYESIKMELIAANKQLPNPATFAIATRHTFPLHQTLLPVAKRSLVRFIHQQNKK